MGESISEFPQFIPEPRSFSEVTKLSDKIKKPSLKATKKDTKNLFNNHNFLFQDPKKGEPVTSCMDVYKAKTKSDGSLEKLKLIIVLRGYLQNKE